MIQVIIKMYKNRMLSIIAKYMDNARQGVNAVADSDVTAAVQRILDAAYAIYSQMADS